MPHWDSDVSMKDPSSLFSQYNGDRAPVLSEIQNKHIAAHPPSTMGSVKSRKEGLALQHSPYLSDTGLRHDQSLLPSTSSKHTTQKPTTRDPFASLQSTPSIPPKPTPTPIEIIDVDAIDPSLDPASPTVDTTKLSPFKATHESGMSSVDSTVRIEQTLYSALGPEYSTFESRVDAEDMGGELAQALRTPSDVGVGTLLNPNASAFEPAMKRKRRRTVGDGSPLSKREKSGDVGVEVEKVDGEDEAEDTL
jgi:hypothetical protein